ncbi:acetyltransferase [Coralliovum pocilloporae]|uniref:acetyltransferase n=1 Tax=Coralliovum pocilloporae TaxID=3066369 RepID=UPI0033076A1A
MSKEGLVTTGPNGQSVLKTDRMAGSAGDQLIIVGGGETATLAYEYFTHDSPYQVVGFAIESQYRETDSFLGLPLVDLETLEEHFPPGTHDAHVAVSASQLNRNRARLFNEVKGKGYHCASYVSSASFVWHNAKIGENVFIFEDNTIQPFSDIGDNVVLWSGNHIGHRTVVKPHCFITSHVVVSGFCTVGEYSYIGVNASIGDEITIAEDNFIAMAAVIAKSTEPDKVYKGNPAEASKISAKRFCRVPKG